MRYMLLAVDLQAQPACLHRGKVFPARNQTDLDLRARHLDPDQAADGARPENTYLQAFSSAATGSREFLLFMVYHAPKINKLSSRHVTRDPIALASRLRR